MGLKFRGKNAWPLFRNYTPGLVPWYLTGEEARFLTLALQQAIEVSQRVKKDRCMLIQSSSGKFFVRAPVEQGKGISWKDEWIEPLPPERQDLLATTVDETFLNRLKKEEFALKFPEKFVSFLEHVKISPHAFIVKREEVGRFLEPYASSLGIKIEMVDSLPVLEEAQRSMNEWNRR